MVSTAILGNGNAPREDELATVLSQIALSHKTDPPRRALRAAPVPVVDVSGLHDDRRKAVIKDLGVAAADWGFVQLINHGASQRAIDGLWKACEEFFALPDREKQPFLATPSRTADHWRETMHIRGVLGPDDLVPPRCREVIVEFSREMRALAEQLYDAVLEFLGVSSDGKSNAEFISTSGLSIHSYPPYPEAETAVGLHGHIDLATIALLLQDQVSGFELLKGDEWMSYTPLARPLEGSLTLVVGEQLEILSNGKLKGVRHRVLANQIDRRMSVACFFAPRGESKVAAFPALVEENEPSPYKDARPFGDQPRVSLLNITNWFVG